MLKQLNLKTLIISAITLTFLLTIIVNLWSTNKLNKEILVATTLEANQVYAQKLATTTERYIEEIFTTLAFSANYISKHLDNDELLTIEVERLRIQNNMFNSVSIANNDGLVLAVSPPTLDLKGQIFTSEGPLEALNSRKPTISKPYKGMTDRLLIFISHPIFDGNNNYLGLIGGSIYIMEDNFFSSVLGQHYYDDGSYVYVVDSEGRIIYHKDPNRLNEIVVNNPAVKHVLKGEQGVSELTNTKGIQMLAGYSNISYANWGVVSQRPLEAALTPINELNNRAILIALPFFILTFIICIGFAFKIAQPINRMATITAQSTKEYAIQDLQKITTWYYETRVLKSTLVATLSALHGEVAFFKKQSTTDALTGLMNRRTFDEKLKFYETNEVSFAIIIIDIDKFKSINDTYGHSMGDIVLTYLSNILHKHADPNITCYRFGGEEFAIVLLNHTLEESYALAEKIRLELEQTVSPCGRPVTISCGIARYPIDGDSPKEVFEKADSALYQAKQNGRNRSEIYY